MPYTQFIIGLITGGIGGAVVNHFISVYHNRIQRLECIYYDDDVISKLPVKLEQQEHRNLQSKSFKIKNTTNTDIKEMKVIFSFEKCAVVTKSISNSKNGINIPKGRIYNNKKNECQFIIKHFNRNESIDIKLEIANIDQDIFNVIEQNITGVKIRFKDKRKAKKSKTVRMVDKRELN